MTSSHLSTLILAATLAVAWGRYPLSEMVIKSENVMLKTGMRMYLKFPDARDLPGRIPQLLCEPMKYRDNTLVSGVVIKRLPVLDKIGMMVRFSYKDGNLHSCQLIPAGAAIKLDPATCLSSDQSHMTPSPACPNGWTTIEPSCFLVSNDTGTWEQGQRFCEFKGAKLATVANGFQQTMLANMLKEDTWIGLNMTEKNKTFGWQDKTHLNYTSWSENEPSNTAEYWLFGDSENCVEMRKSTRFNWNDDQCTNEKKFLCSVSVESAFAATKSCPVGWEGFGSSCYYLSPNKTTWNESNAHCQRMNANLASISDDQQHSFLAGLIEDSCWIGLNDIAGEGNYVWTDKTIYQYSKWGEDQPSNTASMLGLGSDEDCVEMRENFGYRWNDENCATNNNYICETNVMHT